MNSCIEFIGVTAFLDANTFNTTIHCVIFRFLFFTRDLQLHFEKKTIQLAYKNS